MALARFLLVERFEQTHALIDDWYSHAEYATVFFIGFLAAFDTRFWESLQRLRWMALGLAVASYALMIHSWYFAGYSEAQPLPDALRYSLRLAWALDQWCAIAALLGFAYRWRHADSAVLRYLTAAVFPLYILHQTVIVVLAHSFKPAAIAPSAEALLLIASTFALCLGAHELIRRSPLLRPWFGLKHAPRPEAATEAPATLRSDA
ncbi:glucans biosynthesis protein [compost metagenome]